jgi:hypothetical protein
MSFRDFRWTRRAVKENMTTPEAEPTAGALVGDVGRLGSELASPPAPSNKLPIPTKTKNQSLCVSRAVLDAARKDGEQLLRDLRTSQSGLTQAEAQKREHATGPNATSFTTNRQTSHNHLRSRARSAVKGGGPDTTGFIVSECARDDARLM